MSTQPLKIGNQWLRINGVDALTYPFPQRKWSVVNALDIITPIAPKLFDKVPLNVALVDNLRDQPVMNPILLGFDGWVYVGSQRLRALQWLYHHENIEKQVLVCQFTTNDIKLWSLWGGNEARKSAAIQVQLWEILFKSMFYGVTETSAGKKMVDFEVDGNKSYWQARDSDPFWKNQKDEI